MQLASLPKTRSRGHAETYFGTSTTRQQNIFDKNACPLRLQISEFLEQKNLHLLGESNYLFFLSKPLFRHLKDLIRDKHLQERQSGRAQGQWPQGPAPRNQNKTPFFKDTKRPRAATTANHATMTPTAVLPSDGSRLTTCPFGAFPALKAAIAGKQST